MVEVSDFDEYTGVNGHLVVDGTVLADVTYDVKWSRGIAAHDRASAFSDVQLPGKFSVKTTIKKQLVHSEAAKLLGYSLNATPVTGSATACLAATTITAGTAVPITTDPATPSILKITTSVAATTLAGAIIISGTDTSDNEIAEVFVIPAATPSGTIIKGSKIFKTANTALPVDLTSTGGAKFQIDGVAGAASYTVGNPKIFDLVGSVIKGGDSIAVTQPDCWFSDGGLTWDAMDKVLDVSTAVEMHKPDQLTMVVVTA
jgi:hypothetical protein